MDTPRTHTQSQSHVNTQGEDSSCEPTGEGPAETRPETPQASSCQTVRKENLI